MAGRLSPDAPGLAPSAMAEEAADPGPAPESDDAPPAIVPEVSTAGIPHPSTEAFVPPPPMDPRGRVEPEARPDPFREADRVNGAAPERKRGAGLLRRVTSGRARKEEAKRREAAKAMAPAEPAFEPELDARPGDELEQPKLVGVERDDGFGAGQSEDDLLDIPAFLRRQAN